MVASRTICQEHESWKEKIKEGIFNEFFIQFSNY